MTFGTAAVLLLSACAVALGVGLLDTTYSIFRHWKKSNLEERYELEKKFYLVFAAANIALTIRLAIVPIYFWSMQAMVPMIPGAMCLWGVFNALPEYTWPALGLKFLLPSLYASWIVLAVVNARCKRNQLVDRLAGFFLLLTPLLIVDSIIDIAIFSRLVPIQVSCCSSAIDIGPRPIPPPLGTFSGQSILLFIFFLFSTAFVGTSFMSSRGRLEWTSRLIAIMLVPITVLTMTEVLTPWILRLPFHYCPFCLLSHSVPAILFVLLYWIGISASWWTWMTRKFGQADREAKEIEKRLRSELWKISFLASLFGLLLITVNIAVSFA